MSSQELDGGTYEDYKASNQYVDQLRCLMSCHIRAASLSSVISFYRLTLTGVA